MSRINVVELTENNRHDAEVKVNELHSAIEMVDQLLGGEKLRTTQACLADLPGLCRRFDVDLYGENDLNQIKAALVDVATEAVDELEAYEQLLLNLHEWMKS